MVQFGLFNIYLLCGGHIPHPIRQLDVFFTNVDSPVYEKPTQLN